MSIYLGPDFLNFYLMYKPKTNIKEEKCININIPLFEKLENVKMILLFLKNVIQMNL